MHILSNFQQFQCQIWCKNHKYSLDLGNTFVSACNNDEKALYEHVLVLVCVILVI